MASPGEATASGPHRHTALSNRRTKSFTDFDEEMMLVAFEEGRAALARGEVPVGVVVVHEGRIVARAGNETNAACDATRHAELVALETLDPELVRKCDMYVTVEPCVMCAGALAAMHIRSVTFGCKNDKFGGCGSILSVHQRATFPSSDDHTGFETREGLGRDEAVELLRDFYARENGKTPRPRVDGTARRKAKRKSGAASSSAAPATNATNTTTTTTGTSESPAAPAGTSSSSPEPDATRLKTGDEAPTAQ